MTLRAIIVADPLRTTREVAKELNINHTTVIRHLKQIGKVKKWVSHESKKIVSSSVILRNNNKPFLDQIVTCNEKWILDDNWPWPVQWLDCEEAPKYFPKPVSERVESLSRVGLFVTPWTVAYQAPLSMAFSRQEYWSGLPLPSRTNQKRWPFHCSGLECKSRK